MARLIDGRAAAAALRARVAASSAAWAAARGRPPHLSVVLVGEQPASVAYVASKARRAREVGQTAEVRRLPATVGTEPLLALIGELNDRPEVDGILVQLPLPAQVDTAAVLTAIDPAKDVDGFHPINAGRLAQARDPLADELLIPCTPLGCLLLLRETLGEDGLAGRRAVVLGRSTIVGRPLAALLLAADCTVTVAHSRTKDPAGECRRAEILIAAVGRPGLVGHDWVAPGAVVLDVGINRVALPDGTGRLVGDVAFDEVAEIAAAISPVPGGVGPMTVACLLHNTLLAARLRAGAG
jgi:methylenetetrahydrofolate dehydrogenase (NADP+)/methenyltetrahydrofolate cyclohydrolase